MEGISTGPLAEIINYTTGVTFEGFTAAESKKKHGSGVEGRVEGGVGGGVEGRVEGGVGGGVEGGVEGRVEGGVGNGLGGWRPGDHVYLQNGYCVDKQCWMVDSGQSKSKQLIPQFCY